MATPSYATTSTAGVANALLKEFYTEPLVNMVNEAHETLDRFDKAVQKFEGKYLRFGVKLRRNPAVWSTAESGAIAAVGSTQTIDSFVYSKTHTGHMGLSAEMVASAKTDRGSFLNAVELEIESMAEGAKDNMNRQLYGLNLTAFASPLDTNVKMGALAVVTTGVGSATQTVSSTRHLKPGMRLAIGTDSELTTAPLTGAVFANVSSITSETVVVLDASVTTVTRDIIALGESGSTGYNNEIIGLSRMVSADDDNYQGIDTGDFPEWKATVHSNPLGAGTLRDLSLEIMQRCFDMITRTSGAEPDLILMDYSVRVEYFALLQANVRYAPLVLKAGAGGQLVFAGGKKETPINVDKDCTYNTIYFLNTKDIQIAEKEPWGWDDLDGSVLRRVPGYNLYEAVFRRQANLKCRRRNALGKLVDINASLT